ncbi:MAG TPA: pantoate--beta-alanine ligase [Candidatus Hydrogenedentes bacterium]|nr:pantoate--beta-alanine ligase [Candidatus Hydrogenedentota bacterium]HOS03089.1 pantoate--beta-alanine ligase [Candidatus Hydrogenedentota bacterium]
MHILRTPAAMRAWAEEQRRAGKTIGFAPTMGALHAGHASLMRAASEQNDVGVLSVFVNPTQFGPNEDLDKYPRAFEADIAMAKDCGIVVTYAPGVGEMYPEGYATYVTVERLTEGLCGAARPVHFRGVATVVTKLFHAVLPHRAYFGQKDAQQCAVIKRMARDLDMGIEIVEMPIVREADGLAMSSRNAYLSADERRRALCISKALGHARALLEGGERDGCVVVDAVRARLDGVDRIDYVELVDAEEMTPQKTVQGNVLLAVAAFVGTTRLIDNIKYEVRNSCC